MPIEDLCETCNPTEEKDRWCLFGGAPCNNRVAYGELLCIDHDSEDNREAIRQTINNMLDELAEFEDLKAALCAAQSRKGQVLH